jgi:hypothetical protein
MKNYVGRKIRGFRFGDGKDGFSWTEDMASYIGKVGLIIMEAHKYVVVEFEDDNTYRYPLSLIEQHLIEECTCENINDTCDYCEVIQDKAILQDAKDKITSPEIPQLGEGVLMQVSDNEKDWTQGYIIAKLADGRFIDRGRLSWKHARPIQQLPKYTHAELVEKLGHDFEIIK